MFAPVNSTGVKLTSISVLLAVLLILAGCQRSPGQGARGTSLGGGKIAKSVHERSDLWEKFAKPAHERYSGEGMLESALKESAVFWVAR